MSADFTGERVVPGQVDVDLWNEHLRATPSPHDFVKTNVSWTRAVVPDTGRTRFRRRR